MAEIFPAAAGFFADIWVLIQENIWLTVGIAGGLLLILVCVLIATHRDKDRLRRKRQRRERTARPVVFVPVEEPDADIEAEFLTLKDKLIAAEGELGLQLVERIKNKGPQVLADIVQAYDKARPEIKLQLKELVWDEQLMERYSRRLDHPDYTQGVLLDAWARFPRQETLKDFTEMLASPDEAIGLAGTALLSAMKEPQALPLLAAALMWPEHFIPSRVAEVFAAMGAPGARLLAYLLPQVDPKHKERVLETLARVEAVYPPENVTACLSDPDPRIRTAAAMALGAGRMSETAPALMICASDKVWQVRAAVATALGMIGDRRAVAVLEILAKDNKGWVAQAARSALDMFARA